MELLTVMDAIEERVASGHADINTLAVILLELLRRDTRGRVAVAGMTDRQITLSNTASDYPVPTPPDAKSAQVRFVQTGSPTNNVQGYVSNGMRWDAVGDSTGLAYDAKRVGSSSIYGTAGYGGAALRPEELVFIDLSEEGSSLHLATPVAGTVAIVNFFK
jgi:hypothetical protein